MTPADYQSPPSHKRHLRRLDMCASGTHVTPPLSLHPSRNHAPRSLPAPNSHLTFPSSLSFWGPVMPLFERTRALTRMLLSYLGNPLAGRESAIIVCPGPSADKAETITVERTAGGKKEREEIGVHKVRSHD